MKTHFKKDPVIDQEAATRHESNIQALSGSMKAVAEAVKAAFDSITKPLQNIGRNKINFR